MTHKRWRNAFLVGTVCAALEALLILAADPETGQWMLLQSIFAWFACGVVVYLAETGLPHVAHGILLTVLLNLSWYVALAVAPGRFDMLGPLVVASIVFGSIIGLLRKKLQVPAA